MTIVVGVCAPDGIIIAADSRITQFTGDDTDGRHRIRSDTAEKVFIVCGRFALASWGDAMIGAHTIGGLMSEFIAHLGSEVPQDFETFLEALGEFFDRRYREI